MHVAVAAVDPLDLFGDRVDADHVEAGLGEHDRQRQADIAQAQHGHPGGLSVGQCCLLISSVFMVICDLLFIVRIYTAEFN